MKNLLQKHGQTLLDNSYAFIPISPIDAKTRNKKSGELEHFIGAGKAPLMAGWQSVRVNQDALSSWVKRYHRYGIGIRSWFTPAVDIDCMDAEASAHMREYVETNVGFAPARVGLAPKTLLVFRAAEPFTKVKSHTWIDDWGNKNAVEILGAGQQFVAFGTHPGTRKPYVWLGVDSPLNMHADLDLEEITLVDARRIVDEFDRYAKEMEWTKTQPGDKVYEPPQRGKLVNGAPEDSLEDGDVDEDDWVDAADAQDKWQGDYEELESLMEDLPPAEEYSAWFPVLAALKDAEREPDEFKEIAREWSSRAENYDDDAFEDKWNSGSFRRTGASTFTIHSIVKRVEDARMEKDILLRIIPLFETADNIYEWDKAAERLRETPVWGTIRDHAVEIACDHYKRVTGKKIPATTKRQALSVDHSQFDAPEWVQPWVFASTENTFINKNTLERVVPHAFNNAHASQTQHMGCTPEQFATALRPVPTVSGTMYYPDMHGDMDGSQWKPVRGIEGKEFFSYKGFNYLNTFNPATIPDVPEKLSKGGKKAVEVVVNYFKTQLPDPVEYRHAMDWLAWVINNPTKRMNYMLIILGGQGSGKSIIKKFMSYMLGRENVGTVNNQVIQKSFTGWQAGSILKVIEEISVSGHRYDVMNVLKEPISNETLFIERKNRDGQEEVNTASWMAYTNDIAALPISRGDRRFLVGRSVFRKKEDVEAFVKEHPTFFKDFEKAFTRFAGDIRLWFKDWEYSPDFDNGGHAPLTESTENMMETAQDDFSNYVLDAVESGLVPGVTADLIHSGFLKAFCPRGVCPADSRIASRLADLGFVSVSEKRVQVTVNGRRGTIYARDPKEWQGPDGSVYTPIIKKALEEHVNKAIAEKVADEWE